MELLSVVLSSSGCAVAIATATATPVGIAIGIWMAPVINQPLLDRDLEKLLMQQLESVDAMRSSAPCELAGRELAMNSVDAGHDYTPTIKRN